MGNACSCGAKNRTWHCRHRSCKWKVCRSCKTLTDEKGRQIQMSDWPAAPMSFAQALPKDD